jgi:hypothetical protein
MNPLLIATAVAYQCVVTPFNVGGVTMLCKTCTKNDVTKSVICVPVKEKTDEKTSNGGSRTDLRNSSLGRMYNVNIYNSGWPNGCMHHVL